MPFTYTKNDWDKARPVLMRSTGLGEALKKYEFRKLSLSKNGRVDDYVQAKMALETVEKMRLSAIKECGSTHAQAKKYLEGADAKRETGFLTVILGNKLLNSLRKVGPQVQALKERYENRVNVLTIGLPQFKNNVEKGTLLDPKISGSVNELVKTDASIPAPIQGSDLLAVKEAVGLATQLKKNEALKKVVEQCEEALADLKMVPELMKKSEVLLNQIKPYVKTQGLEMKEQK